MIVQPTPAVPPTPRRRRLRAAALAAPVALLAGAIAVGLGGRWIAALPQATHAPAASLRPQVAAVAPGDLVAPAPTPGPSPAVFPTVAADLSVRSIREAQAWLGDITPGPVAVAGWLTDLHPLGTCPAAGGDTRGVLSPLCPRRARLVDGPPGDAPARQIYLTIPPGTRLPPALENPDLVPDALPVVVVGHTGDFPPPCVGDPNECRSDLLVERVTWADGAAFDPGPIYDAYLDVAPPSVALRNLDSAETLAIGGYGTILQAALVRPGTVARIDPVAASAMRLQDAPGRLVWYVRGLETGYDPIHALHGEAPPRYSWVALDYASGATLARGPER